VNINDAVRIVRERWRVVLLCLLLGLLGAGATAALTPRQYASDVSLYISPVGRAASPDDAYKANELAKEKMTSYAPLMKDKRITQAVVDKLQLPLTADQLSSHLTVTVQPDAVVMVASVTDTSPERAAAIANAVADEFVGVVTQLEQPFGSSSSSSTPTPAPTTPGVRQPPVAQQPANDTTTIRPQVIRKAVPQPTPVAPNVPFDVALGAALGLLVGLGAAFLGNARDTSVRDPERLQAITGAVVLSEIPEDRTARRVPIAVGQTPEPPRAEAYRRLRTNLQFHRSAPKGTGGKVVVVTSASIGDGTSVTACNLARALAASSRVILVDANLRHPQVATYLDLEPGPGLTTVLTGNLSWTFARRKGSDVALDVLPSGPVAPRMGELLTSRRMDDLLHELRKRYDFVIIDAPALLPVSDAAAVAARADGVVLVVRYRVTSEEQVEGAVDALRAVSAHLAGTVLSMAPPSRPRRRRARIYVDQPASHLPPMMSPAAAPLPPPPPDRRAPMEPSNVPPPRGDLGRPPLPPPDRRFPVEAPNGPPRGDLGRPPVPSPERRGPVDPANRPPLPPPPGRGPVEPVNGPRNDRPPVPSPDRRGPVEPANVPGRSDNGRAPDGPDEPGSDGAKK
jgi:succinoglycan biosynthesis transport protein ExoP